MLGMWPKPARHVVQEGANNMVQRVVGVRFPRKRFVGNESRQESYERHTTPSGMMACWAGSVRHGDVGGEATGRVWARVNAAGISMEQGGSAITL